MDSSIPPPPPSAILRKLRPWYLVAAMVLTCSLGLRGVLGGYHMIAFLRMGSVPDVPTATVGSHPGDDPMELVTVAQKAMLRAMSDTRQVTFPLSVARLLVCGVLVAASALALAGRRGARSLALQALAATVALTIVEYALTRNVRAAWIDAVTSFGDELPADAPLRIFGDQHSWWWAPRLALGFDIGALVLAAVALTRGRTKTYFAAVAQATERAEEP